MAKAKKSKNNLAEGLGGQPGNRNAFKKGLYTKEPRDLRKRIAAWKRGTRALLRRISSHG